MATTMNGMIVALHQDADGAGRDHRLLLLFFAHDVQEKQRLGTTAAADTEQTPSKHQSLSSHPSAPSVSLSLSDYHTLQWRFRGDNTSVVMCICIGNTNGNSAAIVPLCLIFVRRSANKASTKSLHRIVY